MLSIGNGVITARAKRVAAQNALAGKIKSHKKASFCKRLKGVGRAGRSEPTARISF